MTMIRSIFLALALVAGTAAAQQSDMFTKPTPGTQCGAAGWGYMLAGDRSRITYLSGDRAKNRRVDERGWWVPCDMPGQAQQACQIRAQTPKWVDQDTGLVCTSVRRIAGRIEHGALVRLPAVAGDTIGAATYRCVDGTLAQVAAWCSSTAR
jgi:hypothetical protein